MTEVENKDHSLLKRRGRIRKKDDYYLVLEARALARHKRCKTYRKLRDKNGRYYTSLYECCKEQYGFAPATVRRYLAFSGLRPDQVMHTRLGVEGLKAAGTPAYKPHWALLLKHAVDHSPELLRRAGEAARGKGLKEADRVIKAVLAQKEPKPDGAPEPEVDEEFSAEATRREIRLVAGRYRSAARAARRLREKLAATPERKLMQRLAGEAEDEIAPQEQEAQREFKLVVALKQGERRNPPREEDEEDELDLVGDRDDEEDGRDDEDEDGDDEGEEDEAEDGDDEEDDGDENDGDGDEDEDQDEDDGDEPDDDGGGGNGGADDHEDVLRAASTSTSTSTSTPTQSAPPPTLEPSQVALPVGFIAENGQPSPAEVLAAALIVACYHADCAVRDAFYFRSIPRCQDADLHLHYLTWARANRFAERSQQLKPMLQAGADLGLPMLQGLLQQHPGCTLADMLPVNTDFDPDQGDQPLTWIVFSPQTQSHLAAEPNELERALQRLLGLYDYLDATLTRWLASLDDGHRVSPDIAYQLCHALDDLAGHNSLMQSMSYDGAQRFLALQQQRDAQEAQRLHLLDVEEHHIIFLGTSSIPAQWLKIGVTTDGRIVALDANSALALLALGTQGWGKSYLAAVIREALHLHLPGIHKLAASQRSISLLAKWDLGECDLAFLAGLRKNPDQAQWDYLRRYMHIGFDNAAYTHMKIFCLPGMAKHYTTALPAAVERGVRFLDTVMAEDEMTGFTLSSMLSIGRDDSRGKPEHLLWLDRRLAALGAEATVPRLLKDIAATRQLGQSNKDKLRDRLELPRSMISTQERLLPHIRDNAPIYLLFESMAQSHEQLLPAQIAVADVLLREVPDMPKLRRWLFIEEVAKYLLCVLVVQYLRRLMAEARHRRISLYCAAQSVGDLPPRFASLMMGGFLFHMDSPQEVHKWGEMVAGFSGLRGEAPRAMEQGEVRASFARCTEPSWVTGMGHFYVRPSCTDAGGETLLDVPEDGAGDGAEPLLWMPRA